MSTRVSLAVVLAAALGGCASITRGSTEQLQIVSEPPGATVTSIIIPKCGDNPCPRSDLDPRAIEPVQEGPVVGPTCITPCLITVNRADEFQLTFTLPGYRPETIKSEIRTAVGGAVGVAGNAIIGGAVGVLVDTGTGAIYEHYPNPVSVTLTPISQPTAKRGKR